MENILDSPLKVTARRRSDYGRLGGRRLLQRMALGRLVLIDGRAEREHATGLAQRNRGMRWSVIIGDCVPTVVHQPAVHGDRTQHHENDPD